MLRPLLRRWPPGVSAWIARRRLLRPPRLPPPSTSPSSSFGDRAAQRRRTVKGPSLAEKLDAWMASGEADVGSVERPSRATDHHGGMAGLRRELRTLSDGDEAYQFCQPAPLPVVDQLFDGEDPLLAWNDLVGRGDAAADDPRLTRVVSDIRDRLPQMEWDQLEATLEVTSRCNLTVPEVDKLRKNLDDQCIARLKAPGAFVLSESRRRLFRLAFLWFESSRRTFYQSSYPWELTRAFLTDRHALDLTTPQQFVFLHVLAGARRAFPGAKDEQRPYNPDAHRYAVDLPRHVAAKFNEVLPRLSLREVGVVCLGLHLGGVSLNQRHGPLISNILRKLRDADRDTVVDCDFALSSVFKSLSDVGVTDFELTQSVVDRYQKHMQHLGWHTKLRLMRMIKSTSIRFTKKITHEFFQTTKADIDSMRMKDLETLALLYFSFGYEDDDSVGQAIADAATLEKVREHPSNGRSFVYCVNFLVKAQVLPREAVIHIIESANAYEDFLMASSTNELVEAGVRWMLTLGGRQFEEEKFKTLVKYEMTNFKHLSYNMLAHVAELDCGLEIDFSDYDGPRLDPELRRKFLPLFQFDDKTSFQQGLQRKVSKHLQRQFGRDCVHFTRLMPHSTTKDLLVCFKRGEDRDWIAVPMDERYLQAMSVDVLHTSMFVQSDGDTQTKYVAVVVPQKHAIGGSGRPMGPLQHKMRQLERLGFVVIVVPHFKYREHDNEGNARVYLRDLVILSLM